MRVLVLLLLCFCAKDLFASELQIAVASNFSPTAAKIVDLFNLNNDIKVTLSPGSTGKHYAQISHGAPFDIFLAADSHRPKLLEDAGLAVAGSRFTYARGQLALWVPGAEFSSAKDTQSLELIKTSLQQLHFRFIAIANPELAPYGRAARQSLEKMGLWDSLSEKIVRGENISQAFHFVLSGNAQIGLVAYSQLVNRVDNKELKEHADDFVLFPASSFAPIEQQAVIIHDSPAARSFMRFLSSPQCLQLIQHSGYPGTGIKP